jgi:hypothetical protein
MRIQAEHPDLRRQYEQIVASDTRFGFFAQVWVQDCLHHQWQYVLNAEEQLLLRIPVVKKWGLSAYLQPLFIRSLDITGSNHKADLAALLVFLKKQNFLHLNISLPQGSQFPLATGKFQVLQLGKPIDELRQGYSENVKRSLKKAKNLTLFTISFTAFHSFFTEQKGENLGNLNAAAWSRLRTLFANAHEKEQAFCVGVLSNTELLAVGLFFKFQQELYFMKGTLNAQGKEKGALVFLIDGVIEKHIDECTSLDFIGSNQESIAAFYRKFGAKDQNYGIIKGRIPLV